jgi:hypothetical protein
MTFLEFHVFPALGGVPHYIVWDNASFQKDRCVLRAGLRSCVCACLPAIPCACAAVLASLRVRGCVPFLQEILALIATTPHRFVPRPPYTPTAAPVESAFHLVKQDLRGHSEQVSAATLKDCITSAVLRLTPAQLQQCFRFCGYR